MNLQAKIAPAPTRADAEEALALLARWGAGATEIERRDLGGLPWAGALARTYDDAFVPTPAYRAGLPDLQNGPESLIKGAHRTIQHVGIHGFRLPLRWGLAAGEMRLDTLVTGTVSLAADAKGINMSRIMRSFYVHAEDRMDWAVIEAALDDYGRDLGGEDARIALATSVPLQVPSLRSGLSGWQHYDIVAELRQSGGMRTRVLHLDYVYSSTCPCSLELSEHARRERGRLATPHSQRSVARLSVALDPSVETPIEDVVAMCRVQIPTETQVMVKREDEQAFAELNASNPIFVEDAARLLAEGLQRMPGLGDFRVACSHQESLHSHDAVSVIVEGSAFPAEPEPHLFASLIHRR